MLAASYEMTELASGVKVPDGREMKPAVCVGPPPEATGRLQRMAPAELLGGSVDAVPGEGDDEGEAVTVLAAQPASRTATTTQPARVPVTQPETLFGLDRYSARYLLMRPDRAFLLGREPQQPVDDFDGF